MIHVVVVLEVVDVVDDFVVVLVLVVAVVEIPLISSTFVSSSVFLKPFHLVQDRHIVFLIVHIANKMVFLHHI